MVVDNTKYFNAFKEDFKSFLLKKFQIFISSRGLCVSKGSITKLEQLDAFRILQLLIYNTARNPFGKKQVLISKELQQSPYYEKFKQEIIKIKQLLENGDSITPYLSKKKKKLYYSDELLNDWGINHLHLCPGSQNLDKWLLFIYEYGDTIFFLDIKEHDFVNIELLNIIDKNWNNLLPTFDLPINEHLTEQQMIQLRNLHVIYPISLGPHKVFMGQSHPLSQKRQIIPSAIYRIIENLSTIICDNHKMFQNILRQKFANYKKDEDLHLVFDSTSHRIYLYDKTYSIEFHMTNIDSMDTLKNLLYNAGISV